MAMCPRYLMNFRLRSCILSPGVNSRAELVASPRANARMALSAVCSVITLNKIKSKKGHCALLYSTTVLYNGRTLICGYP
jgi:hypothetical protein